MWFGPVRWGYLRPDQFLDHLTVITTVKEDKKISQIDTTDALGDAVLTMLTMLKISSEMEVAPRYNC